MSTVPLASAISHRARSDMLHRVEFAAAYVTERGRKPEPVAGLTGLNDVYSWSLCLDRHSLFFTRPPLLRAAEQPVERLPDLRTRDHFVAKAVKASPSMT